jgi:hypothetical protein
MTNRLMYNLKLSKYNEKNIVNKLIQNINDIIIQLYRKFKILPPNELADIMMEFDKCKLYEDIICVLNASLDKINNALITN